MSDTPIQTLDEVSEAVVPPRRNFIGWAVLAVLFSLMIVNSMASYVAPSKKRPTSASSPTDSYELILRLSTSQRSQADSFPGTAGAGSLAKDMRTQAADSLKDPISVVALETAKDAYAARMYAVMRTERGEDVPAKHLEVLKKSNSPVDQAFYKIYSSTKLTKDELKPILSALPNEPFSNKLAKVQANEKAGNADARKTLADPGFMAKMLAMSGLRVAVGVGSFGVWLVYSLLRSQPAFQPKGPPLGLVSVQDADRLAIRGAQIFSAYLVISLAAGQLDVPDGARYYLVMAALLTAIFLFSALPISNKLFRLSDLGLHTRDLSRNVLIGIAGFLAEAPVTLVVAFAGTKLLRGLPAPSHPVGKELEMASNFAQLAPIVIFGVFFAPFWEEILFRGVLFPAFAGVRRSLMVGGVVSSLLFGLIHPQGPAIVLSLAVVAGMSCFLVNQTRSLVPSIVMHMAHNGTIFLVGLLLK